MKHETWGSTEAYRLLLRVYRELPDEAPAKEELRRFVERLEHTASERGCPTCGSTYYTFEERGVGPDGD